MTDGWCSSKRSFSSSCLNDGGATSVAFSLLARSLTASYHDALLRKDADLLRARKELLDAHRELQRVRRKLDRISVPGSGSSLAARPAQEVSSRLVYSDDAFDDEAENTARTLAALREGSAGIAGGAVLSQSAPATTLKSIGARYEVGSEAESALDRMEWSASTAVGSGQSAETGVDTEESTQQAAGLQRGVVVGEQ
ncbi:hypothetical protein M427DRAFT_307080 [Gonapodya prolifera JEL478]|uniref:Uncharacterized protein n=1 Tax=Gonapodya prolifera (strain JEL478) TaxID=1344416 RepID=A0A139AGQ0_GONPJ|nr:hypothetical protein M427DRAFT_307080 [Gonapodya prolifera JEL478]|eukprot:KXS15991.1 hypothetical protein M427DRAFT_307080 [Gonapodya prolifera JEL478]